VRRDLCGGLFFLQIDFNYSAESVLMIFAKLKNMIKYKQRRRAPVGSIGQCNGEYKRRLLRSRIHP